MITYWGHPISFNVRKAHWTLEELGLMYRAEHVDLFAGAHRRPEFLAINPLGRVPVLDDDGLRLTESNAIVWYLAERYGRGGLAPEGGAERARVHELLSFQACHYGPAFQAAWRMKFVSPHVGEPHDPESLARLTAATAPWAAALDRRLERADWLVGGAFSAADIPLALSTDLGTQLGVDLSGYPHLSAWMARVRARPAFERTAMK